MDYSELDKEDQKRKKAQQIEWRTKKKNSSIFMLVSSIFEIIVSLIVIVALFVISALIVFRVLKLDNKAGQIIFEVLTIASFIGGMIIGFIFYKMGARWAIKKFNLEDKMLEEVMVHYRKVTKEEKLAYKQAKQRR